MKDFYLSMKRLQLNSLKPFCLIFDENFIFMDIFTDKKHILILKYKTDKSVWTSALTVMYREVSLKGKRPLYILSEILIILLPYYRAKSPPEIRTISRPNIAHFLP